MQNQTEAYQFIKKHLHDPKFEFVWYFLGGLLYTSVAYNKISKEKKHQSFLFFDFIIQHYSNDDLMKKLSFLINLAIEMNYFSNLKNEHCDYLTRLIDEQITNNHSAKDNITFKQLVHQLTLFRNELAGKIVLNDSTFKGFIELLIKIIDSNQLSSGKANEEKKETTINAGYFS